MIEMVAENLERIQHEIDALIGPVGEPDTVPVDLISVVRLGLAVEDFDPIHYDAQTARARGYRGIVAPWPILAFLRYNCRELEETEYTFGRLTVHGEDSYEFAEPIVVGDVICVATAVTGGTVKQGAIRPAGIGNIGATLHQPAWSILRSHAHDWHQAVATRHQGHARSDGV